MQFPAYRARRLRERRGWRRLVQETTLSPSDFIYPMFVTPGSGVRQAISSLPGQYHLSADMAVEAAKDVADHGIPAVLLFGLPENKDAVGREAYDGRGAVQQAVRGMKKAVPDLLVITDVCLCEYTDHGHCGVVEGEHIVNDLTLELLCRTALSHVEAGADMVAPSDMMDGRVQAIRAALDGKGYPQTPIMAYAAKYASTFYGPFREGRAVGAPVRGPAFLPDGAAQRPRGAARGAAGRGGRRRHCDDQARPALPRRHRQGEGDDGPAAGGLQRERRVRHAQGRGSQWLARRIAGHPGDADRHQAAPAPT